MTDFEKECKHLIKYIENKIKPHTLNETGKTKISVLLNEFSLEELIKAVDISFNNYIEFDDERNPIKSSVTKFLKKIGGIAHNNSQSPIVQKINHINNFGKAKFTYWDKSKAHEILVKYVNALSLNNWTDEEILSDLQNASMKVIKESKNWTEWYSKMEGWINDLLKQYNEPKNSIINNNYLTITKSYKVIKEIGSGSFGITYLVFDERLQKHFVIKEFSCEMINEEDNAEFFKKFINEIDCLFDLHHENIVSIYDYLIDEDKKIGCYVMEFVDGKNILEYLKDNRKRLSDIFVQAIVVFNYLENKNICHRDIRNSNILIDNNNTLKLIDFGFVKNISNNNNSIHSSTKLINYPYDLPEELVYKKQKYDNKTEIFFVGQLFTDIIKILEIKKFKYSPILKKMCEFKYKERYKSFADILIELKIK